MAKQTINVGLTANDKRGDPLRTAFTKINQNFTELYNVDANTATDIADLTDNSNLLFSGNYQDLANTPFVPSDISDLTDTTNALNEREYLELTNDALIVIPSVQGQSITFIKLPNVPNTDFIDTDLSLTRDGNGGLYNPELEIEYNNNTHTAPAGTEWNVDGWDDLSNLRSRNYGTLRAVLNNAIGENILAAELVMHDTINDKYYKFDFTSWTQNNAGGGFAYTRTLIEDPNFFKKDDYATGNTAIDVFVEDDGDGSGVAITRGNNSGIYNPFRENGWDSDVSPDGTLWNADGWDDFSDLETRTYDTFDNTYGNGGIGNNIHRSKSVMYIPDTDEYYAIHWLSWTPNNVGGGFSYLKYKIDTTQINEGVKFADGTVLKSAKGFGRVKSTAGVAREKRRIEEVSGSKTVSYIENTINITGTLSRTVSNGSQIYISLNNTQIDNILEAPGDYDILNNSTIQFSLDNSTWHTWGGNTSYPGSNERGYDLLDSPPLSYTEGETVYFRYDVGGTPVVWWDKEDLPGGRGHFRGAIIDYHAFTGDSTWIGTIHIVDDDGEEHITHTEVQSGSTDGENDDLWLVQNEGTISYRRIDGATKTLKIHWIAKVFYGSEYNDD
jgi:hypothetical protein